MNNSSHSTIRLYHIALSPFCRKVRLVLAEKRIEVELVEDRFWEPGSEILRRNPAGKLPVLRMDGRLLAESQAICEYLDETHPHPALMPHSAIDRYEVRRLCSWFDDKFNAECTRPVMNERVWKKVMRAGYPDSRTVKAGLSAIRYHMDYMKSLLEHRRWLAGDVMTLADFTAAAHISCLDYISDVDWTHSSEVQEWYAKIKSRPAFRSLLADHLPGCTRRRIMRFWISDPVEIRAQLEVQARAEGFSALGICAPDAAPDLPRRLAAFLADGRHGDMGWMAERTQWRASPASLWPEARSVIMLAELYTPNMIRREILRHKDRGAVSVYAQGKDYHDLVKKRLKRLGGWLVGLTGAEIKVFVDTAPVMEKPLAQAAGLGWQGKHTNLLSRDLGSWFFLGAIFTTLDLPRDAPESSHCGSCRACLDACPTGAFPAPYQLDARRCISYLTIEHKGPVDPELRPLLGNRIYGCDDCLAACPWNKFAQAATELRYHGPHGGPALAELARLDDAGFRSRFAGSPIKRIGRDRMVRNVLYAIGNSGLADLRPLAEALRNDTDPTVAEAAAWACQRMP